MVPVPACLCIIPSVCLSAMPCGAGLKSSARSNGETAANAGEVVPINRSICRPTSPNTLPRPSFGVYIMLEANLPVLTSERQWKPEKTKGIGMTNTSTVTTTTTTTAPKKKRHPAGECGFAMCAREQEGGRSFSAAASQAVVRAGRGATRIGEMQGADAGRETACLLACLVACCVCTCGTIRECIGVVCPARRDEGGRSSLHGMAGQDSV